MGNLAKIYTAGNLHPRENYRGAAALGAVNSELIIDCDGCSSFLIDMRGSINGTIEVSGCSTIDGAIYTLIPVVPIGTNSRAYVATLVGNTTGLWEGKCAGYTKIRARCTSYTAGPFLVNLIASNGVLDDSLSRLITPLLITTTAAAGAALTLTIPAVSSLKHYLTYLRIAKFCAATLTAAAAPVIITTTNLPGALAFSLPADAAAQGSIYSYQEDFSYPIAASAQGTATTIVAPATSGIIWRLTAGYYVAP